MGSLLLHASEACIAVCRRLGQPVTDGGSDRVVCIAYCMLKKSLQLCISASSLLFAGTGPMRLKAFRLDCNKSEICIQCVARAHPCWKVCTRDFQPFFSMAVNAR